MTIGFRWRGRWPRTLQGLRVGDDLQECVGRRNEATGIYPGTDLAVTMRRTANRYRTGGWGRICNLSGYDARGPQAMLVIRPGRYAGGIQTMLWYWWYRYVNRGKFEGYVRDVTDVSLTLVPEAEGDRARTATPGIGSHSE